MATRKNPGKRLHICLIKIIQFQLINQLIIY